MMNRISSAMTQLTWAVSAPALKPVSFSVAAYAFASQPSSLVAPLVVTTALPRSAGTDLNDRPCLVRKSFALSHSENLLHGPTKMWTLQSFAATVIGFFAV